MLRNELSNELDKIGDDILYTEKSHFAAADEWSLLHNCVGIVTTVCAAASAATVVSSAAPAVSASLALVAAIGGALQTFLRFGDSRDAALKAGRSLANLRVKVRQLKQLELLSASDEELKIMVVKVADISEEKAEIDSRSPISSPRRYRKGKKMIEKGEFD